MKLFSDLYGHAMSQNLPNGAGICYQQNCDGTFNFEPMISDPNWSYESIWWLSYMESQPPFNSEAGQIKIQHVLNGGEKEVQIDGRIYLVDGYAEISGIKYFLEFDGCLYHRHNCMTSLKSKISRKDDSQRNKDLNRVGVLFQTFECEWLQLKKSVSSINNVSNFFGKKNILAEDIMTAIMNDKFYGIIRVDIESPPSVIEHFMKLNHPPIFTHENIEKEMVGSHMQSLLEERKAKFPLERQLTLVFHRKQYVLNTDLAKFYIEKGMILSNLSLAIEYTRSKPMSKFVEKVTAKRKEATLLGDKHLQNTWKLIMNSSYGRLSLNLEKRRKYKYVKPTDAPVLDEKPFVTNVSPVYGEFDTNFVEVTEKKRRIIDRVPGIYIYI